MTHREMIEQEWLGWLGKVKLVRASLQEEHWVWLCCDGNVSGLNIKRRGIKPVDVSTMGRFDVWQSASTAPQKFWSGMSDEATFRYTNLIFLKDDIDVFNQNERHRLG